MSEAWRVSLHGGHSGEFCAHARGRLEEVIEAAIERGYRVFGVSEHAPRYGEEFLYQEEVERGIRVEDLEESFADYAVRVEEMVGKYGADLEILKGFEAEVVPAEGYVEVMRGLKERYKLDYMVGSVHYVRGIGIDMDEGDFVRALESCGGLEGLLLEYYGAVEEMVVRLCPEVVGHLDVVRKYANRFGSLRFPSVERAVGRVLEVVFQSGGILEVNTAPYRRGEEVPYPEPWILEMARERGVEVCFGDDSHGPQEVGVGLERARRYIWELGFRRIVVLHRGEGGVEKRVVEL
ncbi:MAG: histidinol-phosphatase HisJ family protein [Planctomycetota bacterium]|nr:MAG: histidinol-phosphatase HisJ family protein [Planctomycetota bacterium]